MADLKTAVFCWGRFNPPTVGHGKLLDALVSVAKRKGGRNSDTFILVSHSVDPEKNPLTKDQKVYYLKKMFPRQMKHYDVGLNKKKLFLRLIAIILNKHYDRLIMVVGSDRVREFQTELDKYNGATGDDAPLKGTSYSYKEIEVVSAGERDPDAEGVAGMSASKMRTAAADGDLKSFKGGVPRGFGAKNTMDMMNDVRKGMGLEVIQPKESLLTFKQFVIKEASKKKLTAGLVLTDGKFILGCKGTYAKPGRFDLPKGQVDEGETPIQACIREVKEETNLTVKKSDLKDQGKYEYLKNKDIYLFSHKIDKLPKISSMRNNSFFVDKRSGKELPEITGHKYIPMDSVTKHFHPKIAEIIGKLIEKNRI